MSKSALKILEVAEQLFNQNSFAGVGVDLIRDESGCSKTTLYTYYKNKNMLVQSVLSARDKRFQDSLIQYIGINDGLSAINKLLDWHIIWFQEDSFKGCLFVRAVAEASEEFIEIIDIAKDHKQSIKKLITKHCHEADNDHLSEIIYTLLEGMIARFLVEGFDLNVAQKLKKNINDLFHS